MAGLPCAIVRGGTSKGVFVLEEHLPADPAQRDRLLLRLMGSPDPRQIDGLGGADPLTSKVAIVSRSRREGADVEYESVEVGIAEARVNHGLMCGNLIAGVGSFAIAEGLIEAHFPETTVRIYCRSNRKIILARIATGTAPENGGPDYPGGDGESIDVSLIFVDPGGAITGWLLPAGESLSRVALGPERFVPVSIVDAGTLYAFVRAEDFGFSGHEEVATLDADSTFRAAIEVLREQVAGLINRHRFFGAAVVTPRLVKVAMVGAPGNSEDASEQVDIVARVINPARVHKAYAVSGAICLAAAAAVPGSLVRRITGPVDAPFALRIAHPSGVLSLLTRWSSSRRGTLIHAAEFERTARIIMRGQVSLPSSVVGGGTADETRAEGVAP